MIYYQKPQIKSKKIKVSFFSGARFLDSMNVTLVPPVFAQSACGVGGCNCGSCNCGCGSGCGTYNCDCSCGDINCLGSCSCSGQPGTCFLTGTLILLADGTKKPIEKVREGDIIISYNIEDSEVVKNKVTRLLHHGKNDDGYLIINGILKVTPNHAIYTNNEWIPAGKIKIGDYVVRSNGEKTRVYSIDIKPAVVNNVYNLHIDGDEHNYFAEDILVHNISK